uniref:Lysosomal-associated membrane protein 2 n=1 Tax=Anabas testudineus TaxID=64144 RepID=A0AAQ6ILP2_ANATE
LFCAAFLKVIALFFAVFQLSHGTEVNVTNKDGKLCLYASLTVNFSVEYTAAGKVTTFGLPSNVTTTGSKCDNTSSTLTLNFGAGHSWSINFTVNGKNYQTDTITFSYNLNDSSLFPNSESNETKSVTAKPQITDIGLGTCYSCKSRDLIQADLVNMTLSDVLIQAFVSNGSRSENETICSADVPTTTAAPTTTVTNSTSTPTTPPTTTPTPTLPTPTTGKYGVKNDANGTDCLLATFGLRIGFTQGEEMNFEPNGTKASGSCGTNSSELLLVSNDITIMFTFISDSKKFRLHNHIDLLTRVNTNLSLWEASVGSSYMCNKEQNNTITNLLSLYTFNLQVQPFEVKKGVFSTAHECSLDDTSILIPIIVGAALAGLILVVVIAYVIGRRKTYVGYQTL